MAQDQLTKARELIKANRFEDAKSILERINHPTAHEWLEKVNTRLSEKSFDDFVFQTDNIAGAIRKPTVPIEVTVSTTDLPIPYTVIAPIYFQTSNKGIFSSSLGQLKKKYRDEIKEMKARGTMGQSRLDLGFLWYGEFSIGQNDFESAFFVAVREMQNRAFLMKADAVVGMRQDIDLDTSGWQFFYLQMYGTAVRFL